MSTILTDSRIAEHITFGRLLFLATGIALVKFRHQVYRPIRNWCSPLRHLPGPENDSWILGHFITLIQSENIWDRWTAKYGGTFCFRGFLGSYQLCTTDMRAVNYILSHNTIFPKPEATRKALGQLIGEGILSADEETHKRQRRIMNPAFGALHIRDLVPTFWAKSNKLRDIWLEKIRDHPEGVEIDVLSWLTRATLDTIGVAGFGYEFRSLEDEDKDALAKAFTEIFNSNENIGALEVIKGLLFHYAGIRTASVKRVDDNLSTIRRIGMGLVEDKKLLLQGGKGNEESQGRDLLTLLIKSNLANDTGKHQGMSDEEVFGQISTILTAGHETTTSSTTWALYALTKYPEIQAKLREELQTAGLGDEPTMDELEKLSYLNNFMREALRVYAVVPLGGREAAADTIIPVGRSFVDARGVVQTEIRVQKGDSVAIPILAMNRAKEFWGEDALEFKPERWDNLPSAVKDMPGVWGHQMTFISGPHACIGYRFAVVEMKTLIYTLVRSFEFDIDPHIEVEGKAGLGTRPVVKGDKKRNRMPLICKAATLE